MRRPRFRTIVILFLLALLSGIGYVAWVILDFPPPGLILSYGLPPAGGPTGRTDEVEGVTYIELSPGYFRMGSHDLCERGDLIGRFSEMFGLSWGVPPEHKGGECPTRWVELEEPFWIAATEIPNEVFERMGGTWERSPYSKEDRQPAGRVSWRKARKFCDWLTERADGTFRLPTEAEWEYAARAGTTGKWSFGNSEKLLGAHAWFADNSVDDPHDVGTKLPNPWGLFDMHGNVWEWVADEAHEDYTGAPRTGEAWAAGDPEFRVFRGGGCMVGADDCRSSQRRWTTPKRRITYIGVRPVMERP